MKNHIFPAIGHLPVTMLKTQHFTALLKVIEDKGFLKVASRTRQQLCNIMRYAVQQGLTENNPALHLEGVTAPPVKNHYPALPLERLPELFEHIGDYQQGRHITRLAVVLSLHLFIRSSELRFARWSEIDFRNKIWTIPATRETIEKVRFSGRGAKMRTPHIVPLSRQAIAILKQINEISCHLELGYQTPRLTGVIRDPVPVAMYSATARSALLPANASPSDGRVPALPTDPDPLRGPFPAHSDNDPAE